MKIERMIAIIMLLLERDVVPTSELAEKLEVSRRTIFRDIDALNLAGLPIVVTRGAAGGVSIMNTYKVDKKLFTPKDIQSLVTSLESYNQLLEHKDIANILIKLKSITAKNNLLKQKFNDSYFSVDLALNQGNRSLRNLLTMIEEAMRKKRYLLFHYMNKNGDTSSRKVEPYKAVFKESSWYLQAFSIERNDYRIFKLARMSDVKLSKEMFKPRDFVPLPMDGSGWMKNDKVPVIIKITSSLKDKIIERYGEDYIIDRVENGYIAEYPVADNKHGYNILLKFGEDCEVIKPLSFRRHFQNYLQGIMKQYIN